MAFKEQIRPTLPINHVFNLPGGPWQIWQQLCLRSAGFPANLLLTLVPPSNDIKNSYHLNKALHTILNNNNFQEALIWQNRYAYQHSFSSFLRKPITKINAQIRRQQCTLATYLQRYCVKNDTIGFFGPVGWAKIATSGPTLTLQTGSKLITDRRLYFEGWTIDALAKKLAEKNELKPWFSPRPLPFFYLEGNTLYRPDIRALFRHSKNKSLVPSNLTLSTVQLCLLQLCNGEKTAEEIALQLINIPHLNLSTPAEVYTHLDYLVNLGILRWSLEVPLTLYPEKKLRQHLEKITDSNLRQQALLMLTELETVANKVADSADNAQKLNQSLAKLEKTFTRLTNLPPTRAKGKHYAARTLVYEDCRRNITLSLGPEFLANLGPPLSLLLNSVRWFTYQVAQYYRQMFLTIYKHLVHQQKTAIIDFYSFSIKALPLLQQSDCWPIATATTQLQKHWANILTLSKTKSHQTYHSQTLKSQVETIFKAPHHGWTLARYTSPDIMLAASDVQAINRGNYQLVLGELHLFNTLSRSFFVNQHPNPQVLFQAIEQDLPHPCVIPLPSKKWNVQRTTTCLVSPNDIFLAYEAEPSPNPHWQTVTMAELVVVQKGEQLSVSTRDKRLSFDIIEFFGYTLSNQCMTFPQILPFTDYSPRISIDNLVICRQSWHFNPTQLSFATLPTRAERFLAATAWAETQTLPRFVFVKTPVEEKPIYIDFKSPIYIDIFAKIIRKTLATSQVPAFICLTEMLPHHNQLWLVDAQNNHYTSELRLVLLDPTPVQT